MTTRSFVTLTLILLTSACKGQDDNPGWTGVLDTSGGADEALTAPEWDIPSETGDTGEPEPYSIELPPGQCIQIPQAGFYGYRHQCAGQMELSFNIKGNAGEASFVFGPGASNPSLWLEPDSYDLPLVAACCGAFTYENPTSDQKKPYAINCLADGVQQVCAALPHLLRREAAELSGIAKTTVKDFADEIEDKAPECWNALWARSTPKALGTWSPIQVGRLRTM